MKLRRTLSLLMAFWAWIALAVDATGLHAAPAAPVTTNPPATNGVNDIINTPISGRIYTNSTGMTLIPVPGGYWAGKYEVTQKEYQQVMGSNPSAFQDEKRPVDSVSWNDAMEFCRKLTALEIQKKFLTNNFHYCLPTEQEWQSLVADATLDSAVTSLNGATRSQTSEVGSLAPNSLGLYDVRGNVMEFCQSDETQAFRFLKGGSWQDFVEVNLRPEFRWYCKPDDKKSSFGFRCLLKAD
jgi:formylglycine-generating enzyme required for sulfatase activity